MSESSLRIIAVHQELLGTYGDIGNASVLAHRARARGVPVDVCLARSDAPIPTGGDIYLFGGGEDTAQIASVDSLRRYSGLQAIGTALSDGAALLAICAGFQILGDFFPGAAGETVKGIGLLPLHTVAGAKRLVGELAMHSSRFSVPLTGFENHRGCTILAADAQPLGEVFLGTGNGGQVRRTDGIVFGKVIGTYMHGPALARNPELADYLLESVLGVLAAYDDPPATALAVERRSKARAMVTR
ncbi:MAG TPA: glutamine amidotransferase [Candidatus Nanopelagicaceae bacterium]|nr:glutamine amidotransferase [Candidatus Nanopelagicaceae bacterium]